MEMECQIQVMLNADIKAYSRDANTGLCHFGKFPVSGDGNRDGRSDSGDAKRRYQGRFT